MIILPNESIHNIVPIDFHLSYLYLASLESFDTTIELDNPLKGPCYANHNIQLVDSNVGCYAILLEPCFADPINQKGPPLPFLPFKFQHKGKSTWGAWALGFGYDPISDDCKEVRLG
ncbi:hypothetical protein GH714_016748 [Hevea brasiliensis]|uniref:Uncharacterized protein n=1 Tax=Hevea brasiliensis TaxID=3981 RepID=A0A6A6MVU2_HEVBR|nr:hypothetical protein GH714_016748 [Hevea brasiliensis]